MSTSPRKSSRRRTIRSRRWSRAETNAVAIVSSLTRLEPAADALVGQSLGGLTAIAVAAARPELVGRLVLVDISPGLVVEGGNQVRDLMDGPDSFASRDEIVDWAALLSFGASRAALERGVLHNTCVRDDGVVVFKHHVANLGDVEAPFSTDIGPLWPALEGIGVRLLLIRGNRGFLSDAVADELVERVPGAAAITIAAGHNVEEDAPVELAAALASFVDG